MDVSLKKLMKINRYVIHPPTQGGGNGDANDDNNDNNGGGVDVVGPSSASDFGINIINNHYKTDASHSNFMQIIFNYALNHLLNNYLTQYPHETPTCIESINSDSINGFLYGDRFEEKGKLLKFDMVFTPYVNAAYSTNSSKSEYVLSVASHYDNNGSDGVLDNNDRHDITASENTFLQYSVAVGARLENIESYQGSTSYGFGMEFFEDCSSGGLGEYFYEKNLSRPFANFITTDGINVTSIEHPKFSLRLEVGDLILFKYSENEDDWVYSNVAEIVSDNHIRLAYQIPSLPNGGCYAWKDMTLADAIYGDTDYAKQAQSYAVPIVAAKLKFIKLKTNASWYHVRLAARATARRKPLGVPELDNSNWDMYRGFGSIRVDDAVQYIINS